MWTSPSKRHPDDSVAHLLAANKSAAVLRDEQSASVDESFEGLLEVEDVAPEVRARLRSIDPQIKKSLMDARPATSPSSLGKHGRRRSVASLLSPKRKRKQMETPIELSRPSDFVDKLHSAVNGAGQIELQIVAQLKLLLRRERADWSKAFLAAGGAIALMRIATRLVSKEWRDDKDDDLLEKLLGCFLALCTIEAGKQLLADKVLLKLLLAQLFSDKRPSAYETRTQVVQLLRHYIDLDKSNVQLCRDALDMLKNQQKPTAAQPLDFLAIAHASRPYQQWMSELGKPVRECFWIFLHDNEVPILNLSTLDSLEKRKPIVPQGYVGGVEWCAIEYICSHLDLINTILCRLPLEERTHCRAALKKSHFEKIMGRQLRRASQTFYVYLHEELQTWASRAQADGWPTDALKTEGVADDMCKAVPGGSHTHSHPRVKDSPVLPELNWS